MIIQDNNRTLKTMKMLKDQKRESQRTVQNTTELDRAYKQIQGHERTYKNITRYIRTSEKITEDDII